MRIELLEEAGYANALMGMALSYYPEGTDLAAWSASKDWSRLEKTGQALLKKGPDHGKWIRGIQVWFLIQAPRFWWSEMDTYKIGTVSLSASTMHTLTKRPLKVGDFEPPLYPSELEPINNMMSNGASIDAIKARLPEGYLQTRVWVTNYQVLRTICFSDRRNHRLPQWRKFIEEIMKQVAHPELLTR